MVNLRILQQKYHINSNIRYDTSRDSLAILFVNLGSLNRLSWWGVVCFLREFLMDKYVVSIPYVFRFLLVHFIIIPFRTWRTLKSYTAIWSPDFNSPLIHLSKEFSQKVKGGLKVDTFLAMRYQGPSIKDLISCILAKGKKHIILVPMYPHYACSTTESTLVEFNRQIGPYLDTVSFDTIPYFYKEDFYIEALFESIKPYLKDSFDHIIFSYHGIPESHIKVYDKANYCLQASLCCIEEHSNHRQCYRAQCVQTTLEVVRRLRIPEDKYTISFQSRFSEKWLKPFTDKVLLDCVEQGMKRVLIVSPAFLVDCLETLEEIVIQEKSKFKQVAGGELVYIPCLNDQKHWIKAISDYLSKYISEICNDSTEVS